MSPIPSANERYSFETDGYLVVESFLGSDHVARLRTALQRAIARRREMQGRGTPHFTRPGEDRAGSTRIFSLLADDPLFLELVDYPPVMPYIRALLNHGEPHFHASDAFWDTEIRFDPLTIMIDARPRFRWRRSCRPAPWLPPPWTARNAPWTQVAGVTRTTSGK